MNVAVRQKIASSPDSNLHRMPFIAGWTGISSGCDQRWWSGSDRWPRVHPQTPSQSGSFISIWEENRTDLMPQIKILKDNLNDKNAPFGVDLLIPQIGGNARKTNVSLPRYSISALLMRSSTITPKASSRSLLR